MQEKSSNGAKVASVLIQTEMSGSNSAFAGLFFAVVEWNGATISLRCTRSNEVRRRDGSSPSGIKTVQGYTGYKKSHILDNPYTFSLHGTSGIQTPEEMTESRMGVGQEMLKTLVGEDMEHEHQLEIYRKGSPKPAPKVD